MVSSPAARRPFALFASLLAVALVLAGCSSPGSGPSATGSSDAWVYSDAIGTKVRVDHTPTRVAAFADQALTLLSYGITPVAIFGRVPVKTDSRFAGYDLSKTTIVGNSYGEIDLEKLAAAKPDLIVTGIYPTDRKGTLDTTQPDYGINDLEQQKQLQAIAPIATVEVGGAGQDVIDANVKLAERLGAKASTIAAAKKRFDTAAARLTAAAKAHPDIEVTQMYADADGVYAVKPDDEPVTQLYKSLGVDLTDLHPDGEYYWDKYSWENAGQMMTGDVVLVNVEGYQVADLRKQTTFADDPALKAGQVYPWIDAALNYTAQAAQMNKLADLIEKAKSVS
ncbi:MAG TPA: ABC transporter substrate-binding protein [Lacisediminihabitans sp.]|uniref:ABC transporter substrate-binding protein n=1 Tax=Lacisediminihabitans sp. TaxID=2787631 RepID=UPI002ED798FF